MLTNRHFALGLMVATAATLGAGVPAYLANDTTTKPIVVSSTAELDKAIGRIRGSNVIKLAPGRYTQLSIPASERAGELVIESLNVHNQAIIGSITVSKTSNVSLRNLKVQRQPATAQGDYLVHVTDSKDVNLEGLTVVGVGGDTRGREYGVWLRRSERVKLIGSILSDTRYGVGILDSSSVSIERNEFHGIQTDGIRGGGVSDLLVAENVLGDFLPKPGEHPDGIQLWSTNQTKPGRRITIRDNLVARNRGGIIQGIFVRDTQRKLPFEDVKISGNLIIGGMYNGIALTGVTRGAVTNNWVIAYPDMKSWISLTGANNVDFSGNRAMLFLLRESPAVDDTSNSQIPRAEAGDLSAVQHWLSNRPELAKQAGPYLRQLASPAPSPRLGMAPARQPTPPS